MSWRTAALVSLGLGCGTALVAAWLALGTLVAAAAVMAEIGAAAHGAH